MLESFQKLDLAVPTMANSSSLEYLKGVVQGTIEPATRTRALMALYNPVSGCPMIEGKGKDQSHGRKRIHGQG